MKNMSEKKCSGCKQQLSIENFYKNKNMSDGIETILLVTAPENNNLLNAVIMSNINTSENQNAENLMKILMIEKMLKSVSEELEVLKNNYIKSEIMFT